MKIMKKYLKLFCMVCLLAAVMLVITACGEKQETYDALAEQGYSAQVRFDVNGGSFGSENKMVLVDVFNLDELPTNDQGQKYTYLLSPEDYKARGFTEDFKVTRIDVIEREGRENETINYFLAGWYAHKTPLVNEAGEALDVYGELVAESGRKPAFTYSDPVDFTQPFVLDSEEAVTLYAAWIPYFTFEVYAPDQNGEMKLQQTIKGIEINLPEWVDGEATPRMKDFETPEGKTFAGAYLDADLTQAAPATLKGEWNAQNGTASTHTIQVYTDWLEGSWYRIYNLDQFRTHATPAGNYILYSDLDFEGQVWPQSFAKNEYTGTIRGNGHKLSHVSGTYADTGRMEGGLFAKLGATARLENLTFEDVTYTISAAPRLKGAAIGVLAGRVTEGAVFENVSVTGSLVLGAELEGDLSDVHLGCVSGSQTDGVAFDQIEVRSENPQFDVDVHTDGTVTVTPAAEGETAAETTQS